VARISTLCRRVNGLINALLTPIALYWSRPTALLKIIDLMKMACQIVFTLCICLALAKVVTYIRNTSRKRWNGCKDPPSYPHRDPIWGIDLFISTINDFNSGNYLEGSTARFKSLPSKTWKSRSFGATMYHTIDPKVVKIISLSFSKISGLNLSDTISLKISGEMALLLLMDRSGLPRVASFDPASILSIRQTLNVWSTMWEDL